MQMKIRDVAFALRRIIMETKKTPLPQTITIGDIIAGEVEIPNTLEQFFTYLVCGPKKVHGHTDTKLRSVKSICHDLIFAVTSGNKKTAKNIMLGLVAKSMTDSRKVVDILNRLGHSISYSTVEEIETELTFGTSQNSQVTPVEMTPNPKLSIGVAFNNFGGFVETLSGKNTLDDTVGIAYQTQRLPTIDEQEEEEEQVSESGVSSCVADSNTVTEPMCQENEQSRKSKRRRRAYDAK